MQMRRIRRPSLGRGRPRAQEGFTLVELLVGLVILAIGIMGIVRLFVFSNEHVIQGRKELVAASLVQEIREKILSETFEDIPSIFDGVDTDIPETVTQPCQAWAQHLAEQLGPGGRGRLDVILPGEDPAIYDNMLGIVIEVSWPAQGQTRSLTMHFALTKVGQ
jgi:prepilin-type N-terminal cleavage/methylation domain-containing protein